MEVNTIKVDVKDGVYLHPIGEFFTVELGEVENNVTKERKHAVKTHGVNRAGEEVERIFTIDMDEDVAAFALLVHESEYLGEL